MTIKITKNVKEHILINFRWKSCFAYEHERILITEYPADKVYETITDKMIKFFEERRKRIDF